MSPPAEALLTAGYALFLCGVSVALRVWGPHGRTTWPHSEASRFQHGLSLVPPVLAGVLLAVAALRSHGAGELLLLGTTALPVLFTGASGVSALLRLR